MIGSTGTGDDADDEGAHAVIMVGWGEETIGTEQVKYWILQNSWGQDWGDNGYVKMFR